MKPITSIRPLAGMIIAATALLAGGCNNDNTDTTGHAPAAAVITASIGKTENAPVSRAVGTVWAADDSIGVSAASTGATAYVNIQYRNANAGGGFLPVPGADGSPNTIYYQDKNEVEFTAYYPYTGKNGTRPGTDGVITRNLTAADQAAGAQPSIDYLWSTAKGSYAKREVNFIFRHVMSRLNLNFIPGEGIDDFPAQGLTYKLSGLVTEGSFDTKDGSVSLSAGAQPADLGEISVLQAGSTPGTLVSATILWPQNVASIGLTVTIDGTSYQAALTLPDAPAGSSLTGKGLASGYSYSYNVTVNKTALSVAIPTITDWAEANIPGGSGDVDAGMIVTTTK